MIAYAARTTNQRSLAALRLRQWRVLLTAGERLNAYGLPYALDNGAWGRHQSGAPFAPDVFLRALDRVGAQADWVVLPDIVAGGAASFALSLTWMPTVLAACPHALLAVQDGLACEDVAPFVGKRVGIFVGGTTAWKEQTLARWGHLARQQGCWLHVGRVNTARRIRLCVDVGAHSFDGSSVTRFATTMPLLDNARRQGVLPWGEYDDTLGLQTANTQTATGLYAGGS